jgi:hypothetical protein
LSALDESLLKDLAGAESWLQDRLGLSLFSLMNGIEMIYRLLE